MRRVTGHLEFYGLQFEPFDSEFDPERIYQHTAYLRIRASLLSGIKDGTRMMLLTGKSGTGKSLLIDSVINQLPEYYRTVKLKESVEGPENLMVKLCDDLGLGFIDHNLQDLLPTFLAYLRISGRLGNKIIIVIERADALNASVLLLIRKLLESVHGKMANIQFILVGKSDLANRLNQEKYEALRRLIGFYSELVPLSKDETDSYLRHRLSVAGARNPGDIFSQSANERIFELSQGIPLHINRICARVLRIGAIRRWNQISSVDLEKLTQSLSGVKREKKNSSPFKDFSVFSSQPQTRVALEEATAKENDSMKKVYPNRLQMQKSLKPERPEMNQPQPRPLKDTVQRRNTQFIAEIKSSLSIYPEEMLEDYCKIIESMRMNGGNRTNQVIGITSPIPNQGSSTAAMVISLLVAGGKFISVPARSPSFPADMQRNQQSSKRMNETLLIDGHLWAPSLKQRSNIQTDYGLCDILGKRVSTKMAINRIPSSNLDVITAGDKDFSLLEPFYHERFSRLLRELRGQYSQIFVDLPPVLSYGDALTLSRHCDSIVIVVRSRGCRIQVLEKACNDLKRANIAVLGCIINRRKFHLPAWLYQRI